MRSVLTILIFLALLGCVLLYSMGRLDRFYKNSTHPEEEVPVDDRPCVTDLDCGTGICSLSGMCRSALYF
jgi:hypothetical protein